MRGNVVLFAGDLSLDLTMHMSRIPEPDEKVHVEAFTETAGGVIANASVACALNGVSARALFHAGADAAGERALCEIAGRGVDVSEVERAGANCRVVVLIEPHGEKRLLLYPGDSLFPSIAAATSANLDAVGWMHTAIYGLDAAATLIARCRVSAIPWSIDLEPASFSTGINRLASHLAGAAIVFCNSRAASILGPDPVALLRAMGARAVVLTKGADGATWCDDGGRQHVEAPPIHCVDTTGAGDCLAGWLIAGLMNGLHPHAAMEDAVLAASLSCTRSGAQASYPDRHDLHHLKRQPAPAGDRQRASR